MMMVGRMLSTHSSKMKRNGMMVTVMDLEIIQLVIIQTIVHSSLETPAKIESAVLILTVMDIQTLRFLGPSHKVLMLSRMNRLNGQTLMAMDMEITSKA